MEKENLQIVNLKITDLKAYDKNARKHAKIDVDSIVESIKQFGFNDPIGIWSDKNLIVEGHGRLEAAKKLQIESVPCIRLDHLSDEQRKAYALAHNKTAELSCWDFDVLKSELKSIQEFDMSLFGFDMDSLVEEKKAEEDNYSADISEIPTRTKFGDIWSLGNHRLMVGDSTNTEQVQILLGGGCRLTLS